VIGTTWQARTAAALIAGAVGEGICVLLDLAVTGAFVLAVFLVALAVGWFFGPWAGGVGAGAPALGLVFVDTGGDSTTGSRVLSALAIFLMLGGSAWVVGRVRERYGRPPWAHRTGGSQ